MRSPEKQNKGCYVSREKQSINCPYTPVADIAIAQNKPLLFKANLNRQNWDSAFNCWKKILILSTCMCVCLCVRNCVCVCPLSRRAIAALQPATTAALLSAFSPAPVSSRHAITLSNETGENASQAASCKHTVPESITSLSLSLCPWFALSFSLSSSFLPLSRLPRTICGG